MVDPAEIPVTHDSPRPSKVSRVRRRHLRATALLGGVLLLSVGIVTGWALHGSAGSERSGAMYEPDLSAPTLRYVRGVGELYGRTPKVEFIAENHGGRMWEMNLKVVNGCLAFGDQTKVFTLDPIASEQVGTWVGPTTMSNMCVSSKYRLRVRAIMANGDVSAWSNTLDFVMN